jgi:hypothetical protein
MPSTDRNLELKAKTSVAQTGSQPFVYAKGLMYPVFFSRKITVLKKSVLSKLDVRGVTAHQCHLVA